MDRYDLETYDALIRRVKAAADASDAGLARRGVLDELRSHSTTAKRRTSTVNVAVAGTSPRNERGGQVSYLLLSPGQFGSTRMAITLVEGGAGSGQPMHSHPEAEQAYVIVAGSGVMRVDDQEQEIGPGMLVYIPPGANHAIRSVGNERLTYVSATSPPFRMPAPESVFAYKPPDIGREA